MIRNVMRGKFMEGYKARMGTYVMAATAASEGVEQVLVNAGIVMDAGMKAVMDKVQIGFVIGGLAIYVIGMLRKGERMEDMLKEMMSDGRKKMKLLALVMMGMTAAGCYSVMKMNYQDADGMKYDVLVLDGPLSKNIAGTDFMLNWTGTDEAKNPFEYGVSVNGDRDVDQTAQLEMMKGFMSLTTGAMQLAKMAAGIPTGGGGAAVTPVVVEEETATTDGN